MKSLNITIILLTLIFLPLLVSSKEQQEIESNFLEDFIIGKYQLIGKSLNSDNIYFGELEIKKEKGKLIFIKSIEGISISGEAKIEKSMTDLNKVLRLSYSQSKQDFEETCLVNSDLDNYARITCHLYGRDLTTTNPGLEALFIKHSE